MLLILELYLTIKAWNRGWGGWALMPWVCIVWICFVVGFVTGKPVITPADLVFLSLLLAAKVGVVTSWTSPILELVLPSLLLMDLPLIVTLAVMTGRPRTANVKEAAVSS